jgi:hypothetical protein
MAQYHILAGMQALFFACICRRRRRTRPAKNFRPFFSAHTLQPVMGGIPKILRDNPNMRL